MIPESFDNCCICQSKATFWCDCLKTKEGETTFFCYNIGEKNSRCEVDIRKGMEERACSMPLCELHKVKILEMDFCPKCAEEIYKQLLSWKNRNAMKRHDKRWRK